MEDLIFMPTNDDFCECVIYAICRIIVQKGGPTFAKLEKDVQAHQQKSDHYMKVHKGDINPEPAWNITESSREGYADVMDAINAVVKVDTSKPVFYILFMVTNLPSLKPWSVMVCHCGTSRQ